MRKDKPVNKKYAIIEAQIALGEYKQRKNPDGTIRQATRKTLNLGEYLKRVPPDAHTTDTFRLPETVVILGSGKNAVQGLGNIKKTDCVIALNRAVMIQDCDIWMCATAVYIHDQWFKEALTKDCIKVFGVPIATIFQADYSYQSLPQFCNHPVYQWIDGVYRGASVAGSALNMCYDKGVKQVKLCGVDMYGQEYWDGEFNRWDCKCDAVWTERDALQAMIYKCQEEEGIKITSLSETALEVERES